MLKNLDRNSARFPTWNNAMDKFTSGRAKQSEKVTNLTENNSFRTLPFEVNTMKKRYGDHPSKKVILYKQAYPLKSKGNKSREPCPLNLKP